MSHRSPAHRTWVSHRKEQHSYRANRKTSAWRSLLNNNNRCEEVPALAFQSPLVTFQAFYLTRRVLSVRDVSQRFLHRRLQRAAQAYDLRVPAGGGSAEMSLAGRGNPSSHGVS